MALLWCRSAPAWKPAWPRWWEEYSRCPAGGDRGTGRTSWRSYRWNRGSTRRQSSLKAEQRTSYKCSKCNVAPVLNIWFWCFYLFIFVSFGFIPELSNYDCPDFNKVYPSSSAVMNGGTDSHSGTSWQQSQMPELHWSDSRVFITGWGWVMTSMEDMVASGRNQDVGFIFHSEHRRLLPCCLKRFRMDFIFHSYGFVTACQWGKLAWGGSRLVWLQFPFSFPVETYPIS